MLEGLEQELDAAPAPFTRARDVLFEQIIHVVRDAPNKPKKLSHFLFDIAHAFAVVRCTPYFTELFVHDPVRALAVLGQLRLAGKDGDVSVTILPCHNR